MIISYKYKFVFIHIAKNAGTFTTDFIKKLDPSCIDIYTNGLGHQAYKFIKTMDIYENIKDFTFFAIIRNPFDMVVSYYNFTYELFNKNTFEEFINNNNIPSNIYHISKYDILEDGDLETNILSNIRYISKCDTLENSLEKKIVLIKYNNIKEDLYNFFIMVNIDKNLINEYLYLFDIKINKSTDIINVSNIYNNKFVINNLLNNKLFITNIFFYSLYHS